MKRLWQGILLGSLLTVGLSAYFIPRLRNSRRRRRRRIVLNLPRRANDLIEGGRQTANRLVSRTLR